jgi:RNA polymerase sigma-70 factor (ECF subfamily)
MNDTADMTPTSLVSAPTEYEVFYRGEFASLAVVAGAVAADRSVGEDIAQEALSRAHRQWSKVSALDKPGAWVRRVAINLAIGRKRRTVSEAKALLRLGPTSTEAAETRRGDPAVWAAVDELAPQQRAVVALRYLEDRPVAEIAEILEISVSAATSNLHKARTNLADKLGETYG